MSQPGIQKSIDDILACGNQTLAEIMEAERRLLATLPQEVEDEYHKAGIEIKRKLENKLLYGVEEIQ